MFGVVGFEWSLTLRELYEAFIGHEKAAFNRTSLICCVLCNINRDPKKQKPFTPDMFNPYSDKINNINTGKGIPLNMDTVYLFKNLIESRK